MAVKDPTAAQFWRERGFKSGQSETAPTWTVDRNGNMDVNGTSSFDGTVNLGNVDLITREADGDIINNIAASVLTVFNEQGADIDFRIESDTNSNAFMLDAGLFTGVGAIGIGAAASDRAFLLVNPPAFTATASTNVAKMYVDNSAAVTIPAGTTAIVAGLWLDEPNITATGTVTDAATVYIADAPTEAGTDNHALWVDTGSTRLDGAVYIGGAVATPVHALLAAAGVTVFNEGGLDMDFRYESDTNANTFTLDGGLFTGVGAIGLCSNASVAASIYSDIPAITLTANNSYAKMRVDSSNAVTVPAGTAAVVAALRVVEPNITATGTVTDAYTLMIDSAPTEGTRNGSLWVDAGLARFDGSVLVGTDGSALNSGTNQVSIGNGTAPTGANADTVSLFSKDISAGNTTLGIYAEGTSIVATGQADSASGVRVILNINGTDRTFLCI